MVGEAGAEDPSERLIIRDRTMLTQMSGAGAPGARHPWWRRGKIRRATELLSGERGRYSHRRPTAKSVRSLTLLVREYQAQTYRFRH